MKLKSLGSLVVMAGLAFTACTSEKKGSATGDSLNQDSAQVATLSDSAFDSTIDGKKNRFVYLEKC